MTQLTKEQKKEIGLRTGYSRRQIERLHAKGIDMYDDAAIAEYEELNPPVCVVDDSETGMDIKDLKMQTAFHANRWKKNQADKLEMELEILKGNYMKVESVEEILTGIGNQVKSMFLKFEAELPSKLVGKSTTQMIPIIRKQVNSILEYESKQFMNLLDDK